MCVRSWTDCRILGQKAFIGSGQTHNNGGWHIGNCSLMFKLIKRAINVRPCTISNEWEKSELWCNRLAAMTTNSNRGSDSNQIIRSLSLRKNKRHILGKGITKEELHHRILHCKHTSLSGRVVKALGFGPVDWGSNPLTDMTLWTRISGHCGTKYQDQYRDTLSKRYTMRIMWQWPNDGTMNNAITLTHITRIPWPNDGTKGDAKQRDESGT